MKKVLIALLVVILVTATSISFLITDDDAYLYKVANYCSELTKQKAKSPESYKVNNYTVIIHKKSDKYLENKIKEDNELNNLYKEFYNKKILSLNNFLVDVTYQAKNSFNASLQGTAICELESFSLYEKMASRVEIKYIKLGSTMYQPKDMFFNFSENSAGLYDVSKIGFIDKINYIINKNKLRVIFSDPEQ